MGSRRARTALAIGAACAGAAMGCGADGAGDGSGFSAAGGDGFGNGPGTGGAGGAPEQELEASYRAPVATGRYVWVANPDSGRVAYIDAQTLAIALIDAGHAPTHLAAVPDPQDDVAIVLNVLSLDATLLRAPAEGALEAATLAVPSGGNRWAISSDGRWATAWTDVSAVAGLDPLDGFQDLTVLDLHERVSTTLSVGYRPVAVGYDVAASRLFAVTQDGVSVIALESAGPISIGNVALSDDPLEDASTRDVAITPDGSYALVRREGDPAVRIFALEDGSRSDVILSAPVTDLDLSFDGSVAVAVARDAGEVALLPIPGAFSDPLDVPTFTVAGAAIGSVSLASESPRGFLFTNAVDSAVLTTFDSSAPDGAPESILLHAPIAAVLPTHDAAHAIVVHDGVAEGSSYPAALSLVPVGGGLPSKIVGLEQALRSIAIAPDGQRVIAAAGSPDDAAFSMLVAELPSLKTTTHPLASAPIAAGIVAAANRGFVAQEHPDGRISFVDFDDGEVRMITGFELAAQVVDGGVP